LENKPIHFDGSFVNDENNKDLVVADSFEISDEARKNISGNPYIFD